MEIMDVLTCARIRKRHYGIAGCFLAFVFLSVTVAPGEDHTSHGLVGLRPLPRTAKMDHSHNHGGSWAGTPTFEEQKGNYPFVAKNLDVVKGWLDGDFKTRRVFFEHYWGLSEARDDLDPRKNLLIQTIRKWETQGAQVDHILICREYDLAIQRGHKDAKPGPFKEDTRILYEKDFDDIRKCGETKYLKIGDTVKDRSGAISGTCTGHCAL